MLCLTVKFGFIGPLFQVCKRPCRVIVEYIICWFPSFVNVGVPCGMLYAFIHYIYMHGSSTCDSRKSQIENLKADLFGGAVMVASSIV